MKLPVPLRRRSPDGDDAPPASADLRADDGPPAPVTLPAAGARAPRRDGSAWRATDPSADSALDAPAPSTPARPKWPLYVRLLRLRHIAPNAWQRAALGEGSLALAAVLVLADLATAWTLLVLPLAVAGLVKAHDLLARLLGRPEVPPPAPRRAEGAPPGRAPERTNGAGPSRGGAVGGGAG